MYVHQTQKGRCKMGLNLKFFDALKFLVRKPHTVRVPYEKKEVAKRYRGIHVNDWSKCIGCGNCAKICTCQAIEMVEIPTLEPKMGQTNLRPQVDYGRCSFCGQCVDVCPTGSLKLSTEYEIISSDVKDFKFIPNLNHDSGPGTGWESDTETSFLDFNRVEMPERDPAERKKDFEWVLEGFSEEEAIFEATRCLGCALCVQGCPTGMYIPEYINAIFHKNYEKSVDWMFVNNPLPEICGTVCTHRCEEACVYHNRGQAIQIRYLKGFAAGKVPDYEKVVGISKKRTGKKVALIGAGPASLSCAFYLRREGIDAVIYEAQEAPGGMLKLGIPRYRLPQSILDKEIDFIKKQGVVFKFGTRVGKDITFEKLHEEYDAVFIGTGYHIGMTMGIPGEEGKDVFDAATLLKDVSLGKEVKIGKKVLVIGGGDVAMDATRTALRLGAEVVILSYRRRYVDMPASDEEKHEAEAEGVQFLTQTLPTEIVRDKSGNIVKVKYVETEMVYEEGAKRPKPVPKMDDVKEWDIDTVIMAIGQKPDWSYLPEKWRKMLKFDKRMKNIIVNDDMMTDIEGVFAGGDVVNPRKDAISAIADGRKAALGIIKYLGIKR